MQMIFDYHGPFMDQKEIYNAARITCQVDDTIPDLKPSMDVFVRAAHFSNLSFTPGDRFPAHQTWGYTNRPMGYSGFFYASDTPWLDELKAVLAQGYPVATLAQYLVDWPGAHYRVAVGYDDAEGVIIFNDGWCRDLKDDMEYEGATSQSAGDMAVDDDFLGFKMTYEDFIRVHNRFLLCLEEHGVRIQAAVYCPFHEEGIIAEYTAPSPFRKPATGMYRIIQRALDLSVARLFVVGDKASDVEFGNRLQADTFFVTTGYGSAGLPSLRKTPLAYTVKANLSAAVREIVTGLPGPHVMPSR